jgi:hypothetical protein
MPDNPSNQPIKPSLTQRFTQRAENTRSTISSIGYFGGLIGKLIKVSTIIFIIFIGIAFIGGVLNSEIADSYSSFFRVGSIDLQASLENFPLANFFAGLFKKVVDPTSLYTETSIDAVQVQNDQYPDSSLSITDVHPDRLLYNPDQEVIIFANIEVSSGVDGATVQPFCNSRDEPKANENLEISPSDPITVTDSITFPFQCKFPKNSFNVESQLESKRITIGARSDASTNAELDVYVIPSHNLADRSVIFKDEKNPNLNPKTGMVKSVLFNNPPIALKMKFINNQPLTEAGFDGTREYPYTLVASLEKSSSVIQGRLIKIKSISFTVPENLKLSSENIVEVSSSEGETIYQITNVALEDQNERLKDAQSIDGGVEIRLSLVVEDIEREGLEKTFIRSEAVYVYENAITKTIKMGIPKTEGVIV